MALLGPLLLLAACASVCHTGRGGGRRGTITVGGRVTSIAGAQRDGPSCVCAGSRGNGDATRCTLHTRGGAAGDGNLTTDTSHCSTGTQGQRATTSQALASRDTHVAACAPWTASSGHCNTTTHSAGAIAIASGDGDGAGGRNALLFVASIVVGQQGSASGKA